MDRRATTITSTTESSALDPAAVATARDVFAAWLRAEREARGVALAEIARVTKIHLRTLEKLEDAQFDQLPADVFVRGFIRNYARVVGLDAEAALQRYDDCGVTPGPAAAARASAMVQTVAAMAPSSAAHINRSADASRIARAQTVVPVVAKIVESVPVPESLASGSLEMKIPPPEPVVEAAPVVEEEPKKKSRKRGGKGRGKKGKPVEVAAAPAELSFEELAPEIEIIVEPEPVAAAPEPVFVIPPPAFRPRVQGSKVTPIPTLVIDDDDPDSADREREMREDAKKDEKRSFLPAALLDNERGRQGGLTLAVIILLIVATLTLSYLMRRPSAGGEGITMVDASATIVA